MTKDEKLTIYNLLKTASDFCYGFSSPNFSENPPEFETDVILPPKDLPENTKPVVSEPVSEASANVSVSESVSQNEAVSETEKIPLSSESQPDFHMKEKIDSLNQKINGCKRCVLSRSRTNVVPGMGVMNPFVLVIGEGPGESEDMTGLPFVGAAGQLLDKMLSAIGLSRAKNCYIANIVKCRPPNNRNPNPDEAEACRSFLDAQIAILKPKAILCAGSVAVKNLLHSTDGVMKLHGKILEYKGIPLLTTYHPSALLRYPENKRVAWEDLKIFRTKLLELNPSYGD